MDGNDYLITASLVVTHEKNDDVKNVINSYKPEKNRELYVVDNSCGRVYSDLLKETGRKNIIYIKNQKNLGYGAAHNKAIRIAKRKKAKYHVVLNPDLHFESDVIDKLCAYADQHDKVVYMMPKVIYPSGELQYLCKLLPAPMDAVGRRFLPDRMMKRRDDRYTLKISGYDHIMNPPVLSGCFMFMRTEALVQNNLEFDERFFVYYEDFDLIRRLHRIGYTLYYPYLTIVHNHARAGHKMGKMFFVQMRSAVQYFNKYGWFFDKERTYMNKKIFKEIDAINKNREENK